MQAKTVEFASTLFSRNVRFNIIVPDRGQERYPVLYLQHGTGDTYATFCERTDIEQYADDYDLIIVMPDTEVSWSCNDVRPGGVAWEDHLVGELVDYVDTNYPTIATRESRGQAGFSMGGYGAMMLGMKNADRFSLISAHAGSFAFGHELRPDRPQRSAFMQAVAPPGGKYDLWELAPKLAENGPDVMIRFDVGVDDHLLDYNRRFDVLLEELGIPHLYEEVPGGHQWVYVNRQLPVTLQFAAENLAQV